MPDGSVGVKGFGSPGSAPRTIQRLLTRAVFGHSIVDKSGKIGRRPVNLAERPSDTGQRLTSKVYKLGANWNDWTQHQDGIPLGFALLLHAAVSDWPIGRLAFAACLTALVLVSEQRLRIKN